MDALTCPHCHVDFVGTVDADEDYEGDDAPLVTCPQCLRTFDPDAQPKAKAGDVGVDELVDRRGKDVDAPVD